MGMPVVTIAAGGLPVVDVTAIAPFSGRPVTEATNGFGTAVTKVVGGPGMPVVYETIGMAALAPPFSSVKLLLGFNGVNGSTGAPGMTDESSAAHGLASVVAPSHIDTSQFKFGTSSALLDGSSAWIAFGDNPDWHFDTGPFTVEAFFRFAVVPAFVVLIQQWPSNWALLFDNGILTFRPVTGPSVTYTWAPAINQWHHIAFDRDASNVARLYANGVMVAKATGWNVNLPGSANWFAIGSNIGAGYFLNGWIDELRITKGYAQYGSDAGYTVPSAPFPRS